MFVPTDQIRVKRDINPRMELDPDYPDYIEELAGTDNLPPVTVTRDMVLVDGFHRLEAARMRGDQKVQVVVQDVDEDEALALAAKLNIDGLVKSRHPGENRDPEGSQVTVNTGFRLSPE